jgi:tetratricopeptide (TPR) repeat protein
VPHNRTLMSMLEFVHETLHNSNLPVNQVDSPQHQVRFEKGKAALKNYHGHLGELLESLDHFKHSSETYCYMGIALVITAASYTKEGYDRHGLSQAIGWLDKVKALPHDTLQAGLVEAHIRACFDQLEKAHSLLDRLPDCLEVQMLRLSFYTQNEEQIQSEKLFLDLVARVNNHQRKDLYTSMAWLYLRLKEVPKGLSLLGQQLELDPQDPWIHHTMSLFYLQQGDLEKTKLHNDKTLSLKAFPVALAIRKELKQLKRFAWQRLLFRVGLSSVMLTISLRILAQIL